MAASGNLLSLDRYARILGINPVHFQGANGQNVWPLQDNNCNDLWSRHSWQFSDGVSHDELATIIQGVEREIENYLGYPLAPRWIAKEMHPYPKYHRRDTIDHSGMNAGGMTKSINLNWGKFIQGGRRATTSLGSATIAAGTLAYSDQDGDGFAETAIIAFPGIAATITDACEIKVYFSGTSAMPEWEIRPVRSKTLVGGVFTAYFDSWLFIDPDLVAFHPTLDNSGGNYRALDITTTANYVTTVDVYREYNNFTAVSAELIWENDPISIMAFGCPSCGGSGCEACSTVTQDGCLHVRDVDSGIAVPVASTYDSDTETWTASAWTECRAPDMVRVWYYAGDVSNEYLAGRTCDPLRHDYAMLIAMIATARVEREFCSCANVSALTSKWRTDLAFSGEGQSYTIPFQLLGNPFGTRYGELEAWKRLSGLNREVLYHAALV